MNSFKMAIDLELSNMKVSEKSINVIKQKIEYRNSRKMMDYFVRVACILACFMLGGTTVYATGKFLYEKIMVNEHELLPLYEMEVLNVNYLEAEKNVSNYYETSLYDYHLLSESLGIELLNTKFSDKNDKMIITYQSDNKNWISIKTTAFIIGDTTNLVRVQDDDYYYYTSGKEFGSPINLQIDIMTSNEQKETGWGRDFLGNYESIDSFTIDGVKVNLLRDTIDEKVHLDVEKYRPEVKAVFISSGVRYILSGRISVDKMKEIVRSMIE